MPSFNIASCRNFDSNNSLLSSSLILLDDCIAVEVLKYRDCLFLVDNILRRRRVIVAVRRRFVDLLIVVDIIHADAIVVNVVVIGCTEEIFIIRR